MKAITLLSGGLDSTLASKIMKDFGLELIALHTSSPFCQCNHKSSSGCFQSSALVARQLGLRFINVDVTSELLEAVRNPKHGYGSNMNPCIDCRIVLFRKARELMHSEDAAFVISGEVIGQRPMSQKRATMHLIEREAGLEGYVVRPLSARVLDPTIPEKNGWIDREKLFAMNGRGRSGQMALARELGINDYPCPAGGCLLTDPAFARRVKDLLARNALDLPGVQLLKVGRHFNVSAQVKLVVGRDEGENGRIIALAREGDVLFEPDAQTAGPAALARGVLDDTAADICRGIVAHYCDRPAGRLDAGIVWYRFPGGERVSARAQALPQETIERLRI